jgi:hypothetical protein
VVECFPNTQLKLLPSTTLRLNKELIPTFVVFQVVECFPNTLLKLLPSTTLRQNKELIPTFVVSGG